VLKLKTNITFLLKSVILKFGGFSVSCFFVHFFFSFLALNALLQ